MQERLCNSPRLCELLSTKNLAVLSNALARQRCPLVPERGEEPLTSWQLEVSSCSHAATLLQPLIHVYHKPRETPRCIVLQQGKQGKHFQLANMLESFGIIGRSTLVAECKTLILHRFVLFSMLP